MAFGCRWLSRTLAAVAAVLLLLAGLVAPTGAASAADTDAQFTFDLPGTTIPLGTTKKRVHLRFTNLSDETPREVLFYVRPLEMEWEKAELVWPEGGGSGECDGDTYGWYCRVESDVVPELLPAPGGTADYPIDIHIRETKEPYEGRFQIAAYMTGSKGVKPVTVSKWFTLKVVDDPEADLSVVAPDVKQSVRVEADGRLEPSGTLKPGETGAVRYRVVNQGRKAVSGVKATLRLPDGAIFTRPPAECVVGDDQRSAVCTYSTLALVPADQDTDPNDNVYAAVELHNLVTVAASTEAPVTLTGGTVQVEGLTDERTDARSGLARTELPANAVAVPAADVDDSDNQDGFAVVVAANGGGADGGAGGGGGGGGELPITGPQAGLVGGTGLAVLVVGGAMFLVARRRRVIVVAPEDEKLTS
ncbi:hypothetical protein ONA70_06930 [Micromonospora yasonensis]|uniref:hypothetical protein n=1 Tax=Micromonospora yasonensis TaxID=1128667 RepID=UPI0022323EB7|nr:hypothetical protein [Micromonospora yasonensis]MCW3839829.1 hypothetical protein [Micromonospora yasonensis]